MSTSAAATAYASVTSFDGTIFKVGAVVTVHCENDPAEGIGEDGRPIRGKIEAIGTNGSISVKFEDGEQGYYGVEELRLAEEENTDDECSGDPNWNDMRDPSFERLYERDYDFVSNHGPYGPDDGNEDDGDAPTADPPADPLVERFSEIWIQALGPVEFI